MAQATNDKCAAVFLCGVDEVAVVYRFLPSQLDEAPCVDVMVNKVKNWN